MLGPNACRAVLLAVLLPVSAAPWAHTRAQANNRDKARYYFSRQLEMAGPGVRRSDIQAVRQYVASN